MHMRARSLYSRIQFERWKKQRAWIPPICRACFLSPYVRVRVAFFSCFFYVSCIDQCDRKREKRVYAMAKSKNAIRYTSASIWMSCTVKRVLAHVCVRLSSFAQFFGNIPTLFVCSLSLSIPSTIVESKRKEWQKIQHDFDYMLVAMVMMMVLSSFWYALHPHYLPVATHSQNAPSHFRIEKNSHHKNTNRVRNEWFDYSKASTHSNRMNEIEMLYEISAEHTKVFSICKTKAQQQ